MNTMSEIRDTVMINVARVAELGDWPVYIDAQQSLLSRIPSGNDATAPGFDAGIACALSIIPREKQRLSAILHAAYTPAAVEQIRREAKEMHPDSETTWWLTMCSLCDEGNVSTSVFLDQLTFARALAEDPTWRYHQALEQFTEMTAASAQQAHGEALGEKDGCMQGAYLAGHPFASQYAKKYGLWFIGTYLPSLGLENFSWSDAKDSEGRAKSGPVHGSKQFVKCATVEEFLRAVTVVRKHLL